MGAQWLLRLYLIHTEAKHIKESVYIGNSMTKNDSNNNYDIKNTSLSRRLVVKE